MPPSLDLRRISRVKSSIAAAILALTLCMPLAAGEPELKPGQQPAVLDSDITYHAHLNYLLYLPAEYGKDDRKWPLMIFLHGSGERGSDVNKVKANGPPKIVEKKKDFPFVLISPQCPSGDNWNVAVLNKLLDEALAKYHVDPDRVYLTGLSLGGGGTWHWAAANPERFAAIVPIAGFGDPEYGKKLKHVPVWAFHGQKDNTVKISGEEKLVDAVKSVDGDAKLTVYPDGGHDVWTETYDNPDVYTWLLEHKRWKEDASKEEKKAP